MSQFTFSFRSKAAGVKYPFTRVSMASEADAEDLANLIQSNLSNNSKISLSKNIVAVTEADYQIQPNELVDFYIHTYRLTSTDSQTHAVTATALLTVPYVSTAASIFGSTVPDGMKIDDMGAERDVSLIELVRVQPVRVSA